MEDSKKKPVLVAIIVVCFAVAGVVAYTQIFKTDGGIPKDFANQQLWVKCTDKDCGNEYEMNKKEYFQFVEKNTVGMMTPPMKCSKCGKDTVYRAVKCEKCGKIFMYGNPGDYADRCECGYSKIEADRKAAAEKGGN
jgi:hypothetical protein